MYKILLIIKRTVSNSIMNTDMKRLVFVLALALSCIIASAKLNNIIIPQTVDSIHVKMISTNTLACFHSISYDRNHFDEIYDYYNNMPKDAFESGVKEDTFYVALKTWNEVSLFIAMINYFTPLSPDEIGVLPDDILKEDSPDWLPLLSDEPQKIDSQLETRVKIDFYFTDESVKTAFSNNFYFDIDNWRYWTTMDFRIWLFYIMNGGTFSKERIVERQDLGVSNNQEDLPIFMNETLDETIERLQRQR